MSNTSSSPAPIKLGDLTEAARSNRADAVIALLQEGADVNEHSPFLGKNTPLCIAAIAGFDDIAQTLISKGADVNAANGLGNTPLIEAVEFKRYAIIDMLLKTKSNLNQQGYNGNTALMVAAQKGYSDIAQLLLESGADPFAQDNAGATAVIIAKRFGRSETAHVIEHFINNRRELVNLQRRLKERVRHMHRGMTP